MASSTAASWKQLLVNALQANAPLKHSSFFQLATIGFNGRPSNRTVVFRGFQEGSDKIQINTDYRSRKIEDIKHCPFGELAFGGGKSQVTFFQPVTKLQEKEPKILWALESFFKLPVTKLQICWYFTDSWEQFRINGTIDIIDGSNPDPVKLQQREKAWFASSLKSRLQYLGPSPGLPCVSEEPCNEYPLDPSTGPVGAFCLLVLDPEEVDYLNLKSNERLIYTSKRSGDGGQCWKLEKINL